MEKILDKDNLNRDFKRVKANKGAPGINGITAEEIGAYLWENQKAIIVIGCRYMCFYHICFYQLVQYMFVTHTVATNMAMTKERLINSGYYDLATAYQCKGGRK